MLASKQDIPKLTPDAIHHASALLPKYSNTSNVTPKNTSGTATLVVRRDRRQLANHDCVVQVLKEGGFNVQIFDMAAFDSMMSSKDVVFSEFIAMMRRTHVLIGMHGAGLTNIMHMLPGTAMIEVTGYGICHYRPFNILSMAKHVSHMFIPVIDPKAVHPCSVSHLDGKPVKSHDFVFEVDMDDTDGQSETPTRSLKPPLNCFGRFYFRALCDDARAAPTCASAARAGVSALWQTPS
eukprot:363624-Chlamydomonas_euryale.AAC.7